MSQAVISSNKNIKLLSRINVSGSTTSGSPFNIYTVPVNCYAVVNVYAKFSSGTSGSAVSLTINTSNSGSVNTEIFRGGVGIDITKSINNINIGPQTVIKFQPSVTGTSFYYISGVLFTNSP